jgi:hypothetical protein
VLRVWWDISKPAFVSYNCARCGAHGYARSGAQTAPLDPAALAKAKAQSEEQERREAVIYNFTIEGLESDFGKVKDATTDAGNTAKTSEAT